MNADLTLINKIEENLHKKIDDQVKLEEEIEEVAKYTAHNLINNHMTAMTIQNRDFVLVMTEHRTNEDRAIQIAAREKNAILTPMATIIKADFVIDTNYSKEENLIAGVKAILGHITGHIKPETLD